MKTRKKLILNPENWQVQERSRKKLLLDIENWRLQQGTRKNLEKQLENWRVVLRRPIHLDNTPVSVWIIKSGMLLRETFREDEVQSYKK